MQTLFKCELSGWKKLKKHLKQENTDNTDKSIPENVQPVRVMVERSPGRSARKHTVALGMLTIV